MRTLGVCLASMLFAAAVGCGSSSGASGSGSDGGGIDSGGVDGGAGSGGAGSGGAGGLTSTGGIDGGGAAGNSGIDAPAGPGIDGGSCTFPSCMPGAADCVPSGACIAQTTPTGQITCFDNGVTLVQATSIAGTSVALLYTLEKDGAICYSISVDTASIVAAATGGALSVPVQDATGATIATLSYDPATGQTTITCTGSTTPMVLDPSCGSALSFTSGGATSNCTPGTCPL
jgi:hypothetical protein